MSCKYQPGMIFALIYQKDISPYLIYIIIQYNPISPENSTSKPALKPAIIKTMRLLMPKRPKPEITTDHYTVTGTTCQLLADKAIIKLKNLDRCQLIEARYRIGGKTITIKPRTNPN